MDKVVNNMILFRGTLLCAICCTLLVRAEYGDLVGNWQVDFGQTELRLQVDEQEQLDVRIYDVAWSTIATEQELYFLLRTSDELLAQALHKLQPEDFDANGSWQGAVSVRGKRFGYSSLLVELHDSSSAAAVEHYPQVLPIAVLRAGALDVRITTYVSAAVILLMFLNLGTVLDLQRLKGIILRPIGPLVGFCGRYVLMPALGLGLGRALWPQQQTLQLALFYAALAPSGGLANVCIVFLKGNINLSIATTTINSLLALGMLPLWILLVGRVYYHDEQLDVPFLQLGIALIALVLCLTLGVLLRLCVPRTTRYIFRFLKPLSVLLSLCLVGLTVGLNSFVFREFTWQVFVAALCLPLAGYLLAYLLAKLLCRSETDALTLSIETSVLNMTLPIVLLQSSRLEQPQLDLVLVVPITASLLSLLLILLLYVVRRCCGWNVRRDLDAFDEKHFLVQDNDIGYGGKVRS